MFFLIRGNFKVQMAGPSYLRLVIPITVLIFVILLLLLLGVPYSYHPTTTATSTTPTVSMTSSTTSPPAKPSPTITTSGTTRPGTTSSAASRCMYELEVKGGYLASAPNGNKLYVRIYQPRTRLYRGKFPAVIYVGGGRGEGVVGGAWNSSRPLGVAELGVIEVYFNPEGVGPPGYRSEGEPDFGGFRQQDDLAAVIRYVMSLPNIDIENVGVVTFSFGITTAAGCLGRHPELGVKYLIDVEGPSHSVIAAMDYGTKEQQEKFHRSFGHWSLEKDPSPENQAWWAEREAYRLIGNFTGAYLRIQCEIDHIQPRGVYEHALIMNNEAVRGRPWWVRIGLKEDARRR